jgi:prepilin-type N-terminal cleavage/methylation domain-containing protein
MPSNFTTLIHYISKHLSNTSMKIYALNTKKNQQAEQGFTIIELLIATAVFAVVMLIAAASIIYVSKTYVKGNIESQTQQTTRSVLQTISQDIEFTKNSTINISPSGNNANTYHFCIGNDVYVYKLSVQVSSSEDPLYVYSSANCPTVIPTSPPTNSRELLSNNEQLGQLSLTCAESDNDDVGNTVCTTYTVSVEVAYIGGDSSLEDTSNSGLNTANAFYGYSCSNMQITGSFCAVSSLTTTIEPRIN